MIELCHNANECLIFRITHIDNIKWILRHGIHCNNSSVKDPHFRTIGLVDLIDKRSRRIVLNHPGGTLSDYVPFYFTPHSIMLSNKQSGRGVPMVPKQEIAILVSSLRLVAERGTQFLFTDRHAYPIDAQYTDDLANLDWIDWDILSRRDFRRDPDDPGKCHRYMAEALIYKHLPLSQLLGIACHGKSQSDRVQAEATGLGKSIEVVARPRWYF